MKSLPLVLMTVMSFPLVAYGAQADRALPASWDVPLQPERVIDGVGLRARASITATRPVIEAGGKVELEALLDCLSADRVFNPFLDPSLPLPARIVVFCSVGTYVGDLLVGSANQREPMPSDWLFMRDGESAGTHITVPTQEEPTFASNLLGEGEQSTSRKWIRTLGPGEYLVQVIYGHQLRKTPSAWGSGFPPIGGSNVWAASDAFKFTVISDRRGLPDSASGKENVAPTHVGQGPKFNIRGCRCMVSLAVLTKEVKSGDKFYVQVTVRNIGNKSYDIYYKNTGVMLFGDLSVWAGPPSMMMALYDEQDEYVLNLFSNDGGAGRPACEEDWRRLPPCGVFRQRRSVRPGTGPRVPIWNGKTGLPPGKYSAEVILVDRFLSPCPFWPAPGDKVPDAAVLQANRDTLRGHWLRNYSSDKLFHSNVVEIEVVP